MQKLHAGFEGRHGAFGRIGRNPQTLQFEIISVEKSCLTKNNQRSKVKMKKETQGKKLQGLKGFYEIGRAHV